MTQNSLLKSSHPSIKESVRLNEKEFLTISEVAYYLDLSIHSVYKLTHSRAFPVYKPGNKKIYIRRDDIEDWIEKSIRKSTKDSEQMANKYLNK